MYSFVIDEGTGEGKDGWSWGDEGWGPPRCLYTSASDNRYLELNIKRETDATMISSSEANLKFIWFCVKCELSEHDVR